jgi:hypothetical protein
VKIDFLIITEFVTLREVGLYYNPTALDTVFYKRTSRIYSMHIHKAMKRNWIHNWIWLKAHLWSLDLNNILLLWSQNCLYLASSWKLRCEILKLLLFQNEQTISKSYWINQHESLSFPLLWPFIIQAAQQMHGCILKFSLHASAAHFLSFEKRIERSRIERESIEIY